MVTGALIKNLNPFGSSLTSSNLRYYTSNGKSQQTYIPIQSLIFCEAHSVNPYLSSLTCILNNPKAMLAYSPCTPGFRPYTTQKFQYAWIFLFFKSALTPAIQTCTSSAD